MLPRRAELRPSRPSIEGWLSLFAGLLGGLGVFGCAATQTGATPDDLARGNGQAAQGATTYTAECAKCHGQRGEGLSGLIPIMGPTALPEYPRTTGSSGDTGGAYDPQMIQLQAQTRPAGAAWRDPFRNALDVYNFTAKHMPKERAASLKDADYWAVVSFIFAVQGATLPTRGIDASNAASIPIPKR